VSRPRQPVREARAVARALAALATKVERMAVAVEQLRSGQPSQLGRVEDVCRVLDISPATLHRRVRDGSIRAIRHGRALRFDLAALRPVDPAAEARR
jgi:excisionase family DNA binding protein